MNKKTIAAALIIMAPAFVACSDIDVSNINTQFEVPVNDFAVPLKIDNIALRSVLDVADDSQIQEVVTADGKHEYAVVVEGSYVSDNIHVDPFTAESLTIKDSQSTMTKTRPAASSRRKVLQRVSAADIETAYGKAVAKYDLPYGKEVEQLIRANADAINEAIKEIEAAECNTTVRFHLNVDGYTSLQDKVNAIHIENFQVQLPRGIVGEIRIVNAKSGTVVAAYDDKTGLASFEGKEVTLEGTTIDIEAKVTGLNKHLLEEAYKEYLGSNSRAGAPRRASGSGSLNINERFGPTSGAVVIHEKDFKDPSGSIDDKYNRLPDELAYISKGDMDDIVVTKVSGDFEYAVDNFNVPSVDLDDVPSILRETGTDIHLANPQLYIYLQNPVVDGANEIIPASTLVTLIATDNEGKTHRYTLDPGAVIKAAEGQNYIYLSPRPVDVQSQPAGFHPAGGSATHVPFTALSDLLSCDGAGVPRTIGIQLNDALVKKDGVKNYSLAQDYVLDGRYKFVAPLALTANSVLKYNEVVDGWAEDIEDVTVSKLSLSADISTDVPFELELTIVPIDADGRPLQAQNERNTIKVPANAKSAAVTLTLEGDFKRLDGISISATATARDENPLRPDMNLQLDNLKVKVSGKYADKF